MTLDIINAFNMPLFDQIEVLDQMIRCNKTIWSVMERATELKLENYYIGGGCITQTVWNYLSGNDLMYGINDIDFVYYDADHLDYDSEDEVIKKVHNLFSDLEVEVDVKNEARVHLWYESHNGKSMAPYTSLEDAVNSWPTTASSIGIRLEEGKFKVYAPYGLNDMFGKIVRPNKTLITQDVYEGKAVKWSKKWPELTVIPW